MTVRGHLSELHRKLAAHHQKKSIALTKRAAHLRRFAKHFEKTETTEAELDAARIIADLANLDEETSVEHAAMTKYHAEQAEAFGKSEDADLMKWERQIVSTPGRVDPEFEGLIKVGDDRDLAG